MHNHKAFHLFFLFKVYLWKNNHWLSANSFLKDVHNCQSSLLTGLRILILLSWVHVLSSTELWPFTLIPAMKSHVPCTTFPWNSLTGSDLIESSHWDIMWHSWIHLHTQSCVYTSVSLWGHEHNLRGSREEAPPVREMITGLHSQRNDLENKWKTGHRKERDYLSLETGKEWPNKEKGNVSGKWKGS